MHNSKWMNERMNGCSHITNYNKHSKIIELSMVTQRKKKKIFRSKDD